MMHARRSLDSQSGHTPNALGGVRVLIVDDHRLFAEALGWALEERGAQVVGMARQGAEALAIARRERPDLVLLDLGLPGTSGIVVGRSILDQMPDTKIVAVTALEDGRVAKEAIGAGFHGYVTKGTPMQQFVAAIGAVLAGQVVVPKELAKVAAGVLLPEEVEAAVLAGSLTPRERDVLAMLVEGLSGPQVARRLSIKPNTVRTHVQSILTKLQVHSRLEAVAFAVRYGGVLTSSADRRR